MPPQVDPAEMTPYDRLHELANIFAKGFLVSRRRALRGPSNAVPDSADNSLDSRRQMSPHASAD